jgi:predicted SAM-dependent methyltransferase
MTRLVAAKRAPLTSCSPRLLNLGCGSRYHPAWVNVDLQPQDPSVRRHDLTAPLLFQSNEFDAVYHAHVLEHLPPRLVPAFLRECHRVLRRQGVLRVVVPDLEQIARLYLHEVEAAWNGDSEADERHRWLVMEMMDQATREQPGGEMLSYLRRAKATSLGWQRLGSDAANVKRHLQQRPAPPTPGWQQRVRGWLFGSWRERLIRRLLGPDYELLQIGRFRRGGEIHHWMYDRVALRAMLTAAGFAQFRRLAADESDIPQWHSYQLDVRADGSVAKPDSLYVEAVKP